MAALKPAQTRGFLVPDPKLAIAARDLTDVDLATATQGGSTPGVPVSAPPSLMALQASGEVWSGDSLDVQAIKGGHAIPGPSAARTTWSGGTTEGSDVRGWLPYNVATGFFFLATAATDIPGSVSVNTSQPCVLRRSNGDVVTAVVSDDSGTITIAVLLYDASVGRFRPSYARYDSGSAAYVYDTRAAYTWVGNVITTTETGTDPSAPCLLELPTGRLLIFFTSTQSYAGGLSYFSVGYSYSDDGGGSWTFVTRDVGVRIPDSSDPVQQIQVAYSNGYLTLLLVYGTSSSSAFVHYVSVDDGASFTEVASAIPYTAFSPQLVALDDGNIAILFVRGGTSLLYIGRKYQPYSDFIYFAQIAPSASVNGFTAQPDCLAATLLEDRTIGILAVGADDGTNAPGLRFLRIPQDAASVSDIISVPYNANLYDADVIDYGAGTGATQYIPSARSVCVFGSQLLLAYDTVRAASYSAAILLGGYSSIDFNGPSFGIYQSVALSERYGAWWDAGYLPSSSALWTTAGAGTEGSSVDRLLSYDFSGGATTRTNTRYGTAGADVWIQARVRVDAGGSLAATEVGLILQSADGVTDYQVEVRLSTNGIRLYDTHGAATKGTDATLSTASEMIDVFASLTSGGRCVVWYKAATSNVWTLGPYGNAAAKGASPASVPRVVWGCVAASTSKVTWADVGSCCDVWTWGLPTSVTEPAQPRVTFGREVSIWPTFLADGTAISATSGPAAKGEAWTITPAYTYPTENLDPLVNPAPSLEWRSADDQAEQIIGWDLGAEDGPDSALLGIYLQGVNFPSLTVQQDDGAAGWTTLLSLSTVVVAGDFERAGFRVTAGAGDVTGSRSVGRDELAGTWAILTDAGDDYYVKILRNSQGTWNTTSGVLTTTLTLDATATEVAALPASGTIQILAPEVAAVFVPFSTTRQLWRIVIPARSYISAPESYHRATVMMLGPYLAVGWDWANARTVSMEPLQKIAETETGKRAVTTLSTRPRRTVEVVWTDQIPAADTLGEAPVPQSIAGYYSAADPDHLGFPLAHQADARQVEDLLLRAQGARYPVVLLSRVPLIEVGDSGGSAVITGRDVLLYGQIINGSTRTEPYSDEDVTQLTTISALRIEEVKG